MGQRRRGLKWRKETSNKDDGPSMDRLRYALRSNLFVFLTEWKRDLSPTTYFRYEQTCQKKSIQNPPKWPYGVVSCDKRGQSIIKPGALLLGNAGKCSFLWANCDARHVWGGVSGYAAVADRWTCRWVVWGLRPMNEWMERFSSQVYVFSFSFRACSFAFFECFTRLFNVFNGSHSVPYSLHQRLPFPKLRVQKSGCQARRGTTPASSLPPFYSIFRLRSSAFYCISPPRAACTEQHTPFFQLRGNPRHFLSPIRLCVE